MMKIGFKMHERTDATAATSERGAIAIFLALALGLLLLVTTIYASRLQVSELSQSSQVDRSDQAYYAAEAGIEDALRIINKNPNGDLEDMFPNQYIGKKKKNAQVGDMFALINNGGNAINIDQSLIDTENGAAEIGQLAWRNRKVFDSNVSMTGSLVKDETLQYDTSSLARNVGGKIFTNSTGDASTVKCKPGPPASFCDDANDVGGNSLYTNFDGLKFCWRSDNGAPNIELTVVSWQISNKSNVKTAKVMILPGLNSPVTALNGIYGRIDYLSLTSPPYNNCFAFTGPSSMNPAHDWRYIFRLKPVFPSGSNNQAIISGSQNHFSISYKAEFVDLANNKAPLYIPRGSYLIDVIGQSGDIRRRLVAKKELSGKLINLFDFVLYSGTPGVPLCKVGVQGYDPSCNSITIPN